MNFDYSYRAFLITCLLVGGLFLVMITLGVRNETSAVSEELLSVDYIEEEEEIPLEESEQVKITTNSAYNEALKFISEQEASRNIETATDGEPSEELSEDDQIDFNVENEALEKAKSKLEETRNRLKQSAKKNNVDVGKSVNRNTTMSYRLVDRKSLQLPNPVYTCAYGGKVVINIEVNDMGNVIKTGYNRKASSTSNQCLIDSAMEYAVKAKFTTAVGITSQLGTITYNFPGQI